MSLRIRLVLVAAAAVAAAVVFASVIVYFVVRGELYGPIDTGLRTAATQIHFPQVAAVTAGTRPNQFILHGPGFAPGQASRSRSGSCGTTARRTCRITPSRTRWRRSPSPPTREGWQPEPRSRSSWTRTWTGRQRGSTPRSSSPATPSRSRLPLDAADHALSKIRLWLILVAIGGIGVASAAGFVVASAALRPVRRLSDTAEHVRLTQDLTQRIEVTGHDELSQLATTFNAMLASLDDAAQRQRQLVQDASHELRTPLTSLRTNIEVLASNHAIPAEERSQLLADVVAQLSEMTALIAELTELARGEEQQTPLEEVRLDLLAEEAIRRTARNHPDVPIDAELAPTTAVGTPATLERAFANLLDNAAKWSPAGSHIDVRLNDGELSVRDRGPGISDTDLPHIFERFYRATSARSMPGSGLGLAIVKQVAEAHGGTVVAERAPEGGTIMRFTIGNGNGAGGTGKS